MQFAVLAENTSVYVQLQVLIENRVQSINTQRHSLQAPSKERYLLPLGVERYHSSTELTKYQMVYWSSLSAPFSTAVPLHQPWITLYMTGLCTQSKMLCALKIDLCWGSLCTMKLKGCYMSISSKHAASQGRAMEGQSWEEEPPPTPLESSCKVLQCQAIDKVVWDSRVKILRRTQKW